MKTLRFNPLPEDARLKPYRLKGMQPDSLLILLLAVQKQQISKGYQHPKWLTISGVLIALVLAVIAAQVMFQEFL
jgi:hypothetical protein